MNNDYGQWTMNMEYGKGFDKNLKSKKLKIKLTMGFPQAQF